MIEAELRCFCRTEKDLFEGCRPSPRELRFSHSDTDPEIFLTIHLTSCISRVGQGTNEVIKRCRDLKRFGRCKTDCMGAAPLTIKVSRGHFPPQRRWGALARKIFLPIIGRVASCIFGIWVVIRGILSSSFRPANIPIWCRRLPTPATRRPRPPPPPSPPPSTASRGTAAPSSTPPSVRRSASSRRTPSSPSPTGSRGPAPWSAST